jgi:hypothetical protein
MTRERTTLIAGAGTIAKFRSTFGPFGPRRPSPTRWPVHTTLNMGRPTGRSRMSETGTGSWHLTRTVRPQAARLADAAVARMGSQWSRRIGLPLASSDDEEDHPAVFGPEDRPPDLRIGQVLLLRPSGRGAARVCGPGGCFRRLRASGPRASSGARGGRCRCRVVSAWTETLRIRSEGRDQEFESGVSARAVARRPLLVTPRPASQPSQARSAPHPERNTRADESCQACEQKAGVDQPGGPATDGRRGPPVPGNRSTQLEGIREIRSIWTQRHERCRMRPCPSGGSAGLETPCVPACTG